MASLKNNMPAGFWVPNGVIDTPLLDQNEKIVYITIRRHLNNKVGAAWPGRRRLAKETRSGTDTIKAAIDGLIDKGILQVDGGKDEKGAYKRSTYTFTDTAETWEAQTVEEMRAAAYKKPITDADKREQAKQLLLEVGFTKAEVDALYRNHDAERTSTGAEDMEKGPRYLADTESPEKFVSKEKNTTYNVNITTESVYKQSQNASLGVYGHTMQPTTPKNDVQEPTLQPTTNAADLEKLVNAAVSDMAVKNTGLPLEWSEADTADAIARFRGAVNVRSARAYMREICRDIMQAKQATGTGAGTRAGRQGAGKPPAGNFANFEQRKYDPQELERALLMQQGLLTEEQAAPKNPEDRAGAGSGAGADQLPEDQLRELSGQIQETGTRQKERQDRRQTGRETCPPRK